MAEINIDGSSLGNNLTDLLMCDDLEPGDEASYALAKAIYLYHPLGAKMAEAPIAAVQSQDRAITIPGAPEEPIIKAFLAEWSRLDCDRHIFSGAVTARIYGVGALVIGIKGQTPAMTKKPLDFDQIVKRDIYFNVLDPLNVAGSFSNLSDPNSSEFQRYTTVTTQGYSYHPSRVAVLMNENPVYLSYEASAYGWTGRSVYQRALFPMKSFIQTMITDDMVTKKAGLLVAALKTAGSIVNSAMQAIMGVKRALLKEAKTGNVISIGIDETISAIDLTNVAGASERARKNILENCAMAADMPAKWLNNESFAEGFGEGSEDAKAVARYVDRYRLALEPIYRFVTNIVQRRAWTEEFYTTIQQTYPDTYGDVDYQTALYGWINSFSATWPSLLTEPDSEKAKTEDIKLKAVIGLVETLIEKLDPANQASLIEWAINNINESKVMFPNPLVLDIPALQDFLEEAYATAQEAAKNLQQGSDDQGEQEGPDDTQERKPRVAADSLSIVAA